MKCIALIAAITLCLAGASNAAGYASQLGVTSGIASGTASGTTSGIASDITAGTTHGQALQVIRADATPAARAALPDLAITRHDQIVTSLSHLPQLPEPAVFAMMLIGLVLIGYRVSRDASDKFR